MYNKTHLEQFREEREANLKHKQNKIRECIVESIKLKINHYNITEDELYDRGTDK